jgi:Lipase
LDYQTFAFVGLDPAFPLYSDGGTRTRLSHEDAKFVGYPWPLGHADFFPNGGVPLQPGCVESELSKNQWLSIIRKFQMLLLLKFVCELKFLSFFSGVQSWKGLGVFRGIGLCLIELKLNWKID